MSQPAPIFVRRVDVDRSQRFAAAAVLALVVHGIFTGIIGLLSLYGLLQGPKKPPKSEAVSLVSVSDSRWQTNRQLADAPQPERKAPTRPPAPEVAPKHEAIPKGQIVDVAAGNDQKPDDAAFLADHDNKVAKQTRAREQTANYRHAMPTKTTSLPGAEEKQTPGGPAGKRGNNGVGDDEQAKHEGVKAGHQEIPSDKPKQELAMAEQDPHGEIHNQNQADAKHGNSARLLLSPGELSKVDEAVASEGRAGTPGEDAVPSSGKADQVAGAAANDHLDNIATGDGTFLNTREFRFAQFFNRVKQRVGEQWDISDVMRKHDPRGAYNSDRNAVLAVTLDTEGRIVAINIAKSSGTSFFDQEAVAAFERAQPFPNPPKAIFDDDGLLRFGFGFYWESEMRGGSAFRMFRPPGR